MVSSFTFRQRNVSVGEKLNFFAPTAAYAMLTCREAQNSQYANGTVPCGIFLTLLLTF